MNDDSNQWTDERVAEQFKLEVRQRFEEENARWRARETADLDRLAKAPDWEDRMRNPNFAAGMAVRDSFFWDIYSSSTINYEYNSVQVVLPNGFAIYADFVDMFGRTSVGWGTPSVGGKIIDGESYTVIDVLLVDYWDDKRAAAWPERQRTFLMGLTQIQKLKLSMEIFDRYLEPGVNDGGVLPCANELHVVGVHCAALGGDDRAKLEAMGWEWDDRVWKLPL